ncbi:MAG TPA: hypothetical protein VK698_17015, partial [Kofleriaceae bacterium]|nr:hypothetical protein [Kofleriaceae bacterium]
MSERGGGPPGDERDRSRGWLDDDDDDMDAMGAERLLPRLDGVPGPAQRISSARTAGMVASILDAASVAAAGTGPGAGSIPGSDLRPGAGSTWMRGATSGAISDAISGAAPTGRAGSIADAGPPPLSPFDVTRTIVFDPPVTRRHRRFSGTGVAVVAVLAVASIASGAAGVWIALAGRPDAESASRAAAAPAASP